MEYKHPAIRRGYLRQLWAFLRASPLVERISVRAFRASIFFKSGVRETWHKEKTVEKKMVIPYNPFIGKQLSLEHQYEYEALENPLLAKMHLIRWRNWRKGSFITQRMVIQEFLQDLLTEGYFRIEFPREEIVADLKRLSSDDIWRKHVAKRGFVMQYGNGRSMPGRKIIEQFSDWGEAEQSFKDNWIPSRLYLHIKRLLRTYSDVTRHSVMCQVARRTRCRFVSPNFYRLILQKLQLTNQVIADPYPSFGAKAIACILDGHVYCSNGNFSRLADFLGTSFEELNRESYDVVFLDYGFIDPGEQLIPDLKFWAHRADIKIVFVPERLLNVLPKPTYVLKIYRLLDKYYSLYIYR